MSPSSVTVFAALCIQYFFARAFTISLPRSFVASDQQGKEWKAHWQARAHFKIALIVTDNLCAEGGRSTGQSEESQNNDCVI